MLYNNQHQQYYAQQQQQQQYAQQQHMNINHMLSPRAPASSVLNYQYARYSRSPKMSTTQPLTHQDSSSNKLNRFMQNMWQRNNNKVDPVKLSQPMFDRKAIELSSSVWRDQIPIINNPPTSNMLADPVAARQRSSLLRHQQQQPIIEAPASPKLSSWLPGLFHFKQPKVCSLDCEARDEREAIGKISQVLEEVNLVIQVFYVFLDSNHFFSIWKDPSMRDKILTVELDVEEK
jgi:hypothetical protein